VQPGERQVEGNDSREKGKNQTVPWEPTVNEEGNREKKVLVGKSRKEKETKKGDPGRKVKPKTPLIAIYRKKSKAM